MTAAQTIGGEQLAAPDRDRRAHSLPVRLAHGIEDGVLAVLLVAIFLVTLTEVAARFIFHAPLSWSIEADTTLMIWLAFVGLAVGIRDKAHVSFELLEDRFRGVLLTLLKLLQAVIMGFLLLVLGYGGIGLVQLGLGQVMPSGIPQWLAFGAVPVGCGLGLLHLVADVVQTLRAAVPGTAGDGPEVA